jgi:hypothetical protein
MPKPRRKVVAMKSLIYQLYFDIKYFFRILDIIKIYIVFHYIIIATTFRSWFSFDL